MNLIDRLICLCRGHEWSRYEDLEVHGAICVRCGRLDVQRITPRGYRRSAILPAAPKFKRRFSA